MNWGYISNLVPSAGPLTEVLGGRKSPINVLLYYSCMCPCVYTPVHLKKLCAAVEMHKIQHNTGEVKKRLI